MVDSDRSDLIQATGLALALVGSLMEVGKVLPRGEFSRHLANLANVTNETDAAQGDILDRWADIAALVSRSRQN
jgi:hypothetical protein